MAVRDEDRDELFLGVAALAVDVWGVEQGDAEIERPVHDLARRREIEPAAEIVAAQPDQRDLQAGSTEISQFHGRPPAFRIASSRARGLPASAPATPPGSGPKFRRGCNRLLIHR